MKNDVPSDFAFLLRHRKIWALRPELRSVYQEWFRQLSGCVLGLRPIVEVGSGPGFYKEYWPQVIATDLVPSPWIDVASDACSLPFRSDTVGALVMVDVLHHLPWPLKFIAEAGRVLRLGGRLAAIEPWITPLSFLLYRYLHHEECRLGVDLYHPFNDSEKGAFDGNAAIPYQLIKYFGEKVQPLRLIRAETFLALPYLLTLGFKRTRPIPQPLINFGKVCERLLGSVGRFNATRILVVWEKTLRGSVTPS